MYQLAKKQAVIALTLETKQHRGQLTSPSVLRRSRVWGRSQGSDPEARGLTSFCKREGFRTKRLQGRCKAIQRGREEGTIGENGDFQFPQ